MMSNPPVQPTEQPPISDQEVDDVCGRLREINDVMACPLNLNHTAIAIAVSEAAALIRKLAAHPPVQPTEPLPNAAEIMRLADEYRKNHWLGDERAALKAKVDALAAALAEARGAWNLRSKKG